MVIRLTVDNRWNEFLALVRVPSLDKSVFVFSYGYVDVGCVQRLDTLERLPLMRWIRAPLPVGESVTLGR